ncbi:gp53-like domain-containing protein, partial [Pseudomonas viridiflava]
TTRFPIPFPNDAGAVIVGAYNNASSGDYTVRLSDGVNGANGGAVSNDSFKTYNTGVTGSAGLSYIAVGN